MTNNPMSVSAATGRSAWGMISVVGVLLLLLVLVGIRGMVTGVQEQELQESRRVIHDIRRELDSLRNERRTVLDSVAELRALHSLLNTEVVALRESRSQYFSDTRERVVADVIDRIDRELREMEIEARRAIEYRALLEWLNVGRSLAVQHHVPQVDLAAEAATIARLEKREKPYLDRFERLLTLTDSLRDAGEDLSRRVASTIALSAALDTASIFGDSVHSIRRDRTERSQLELNRTMARGDWLRASPPNWRNWSYGVTFEDLTSETSVDEPGSLFSRLQAFHEEILENGPETTSALTVFESILDFPTMERLLPEDRQSLERRIRLFLEQRSDVIGVPLEVRVQDIDDPTIVVRAGETVLENVAGARSELIALRRAMLLTEASLNEGVSLR